jgi:hypothetical protein
MTRLDQTDAAFDSVASAKEIEALYVQNAAAATYDGERLTLAGIGPTTLMFSDRPDRVVAHVPTAEFVENWGEGSDSFASDPPNAVLSSFDGDEVNDVVVVLSEPELSGLDLSYAVSVTDGELAAASAESSLFIDPVGRPLSPVSFAGARRRGRRRGRRRARRRGGIA